MIKSLLMLTALNVAPVKSSDVWVSWPARGSKVICGGTLDGQDLKIREVLPDELLAADSESERALIYIDLHRQGQVRWVFSETMTDADYAARQALLAKLSPEEAALVKNLTANRHSDFFAGPTDAGFVHLRTDSGTRSLSLSCQEVRQ